MITKPNSRVRAPWRGVLLGLILVAGLAVSLFTKPAATPAVADTIGNCVTVSMDHDASLTTIPPYTKITATFSTGKSTEIATICQQTGDLNALTFNVTMVSKTGANICPGPIDPIKTSASSPSSPPPPTKKIVSPPPKGLVLQHQVPPSTAWVPTSSPITMCGFYRYVFASPPVRGAPAASPTPTPASGKRFGAPTPTPTPGKRLGHR